MFVVFFNFSFLYFGGVFNNTIIPLALIDYEMIIVWLSTIFHPVCARRIIVKCDMEYQLEVGKGKLTSL